MYTNLKIYVKIITMEKLVRKNRIFTLFFALVIVITCAFGLLQIKHADAEQNTSIELTSVLPESGMELYELSSPIDAYSWGDNIAIVQSGSLLLHFNGSYLAPISLTSPKQIKRLDDKSLIVSRNGSICKVDLSTGLPAISELKTIENNTVGGNDFDSNQSYIVSEFANDINIYTITSGVISEPTTWKNQKDADTSICMNNKNEVFYVKGGKLFKCPINDKSAVTELSTDSPTTMIAKEDFLYYIDGTSIVRINTVDGSKKQFVLNAHTDYDLGNLSTPESISFKGENILIADSTIDAVQEFTLNEETNSLEFTGFAVAKDKTAFNRIGKTAKDVDVSGNMVAVLDNFKLTVITDDGENKTYKNFLQKDTGTLEKIAFGKNSIIGFDNLDDFRICLIDLTKSEDNIKLITVQDKITSVAYRFGNFYYSTITAGLSQTTMHVFKSNGESIDSFTKIFDYAYDNGSTKEPTFTVSADGLVNVYNPANGQVASFVKTDDSYLPAPTSTFTSTTLTKLESDFINNLFGLCNSSIVYSDGVKTFTSFLTINGEVQSNVTSFSMDENKKTAYFTVDGFEGLYKTDMLPNFSVDKIKTNNYKTTSSSANLQDLKICTLSNEWIYSVTPIELGVNEHGYSIVSEEQSIGKEYLFVCSTDYTVTLGGFTKTVNYSILAGQDGELQNAIFLTNTSFVTDVTAIDTTDLESSFVFTNVNMYYLPIISMENTYCLSNEGSLIRLNKGDEIKATENLSYLAKVTFLDKEFYFASVVKGETTYTGYIPVNFTVEKLDKDVVTKTYTIESVKKTVVKNADGDEIFSLNKGDQVRVYNVKDGVATIEYFDGEFWKQGYISNTDVAYEENVTIRNAIIIILMTASVFITTAFFILKKKRS